MARIRREKEKRQLPFIMWIALGLIAAVIMVGTYSFAKYTTKDEGDSVYVADTVYVSSAILEAPVNDTYKVYTLREGTTAISINIANYADELRTSDIETYYMLAIYDDETQGFGGYSADAEITLESTGDNETVIFDNIPPGRYRVELIDSSPYYVELGAIFVIPEETDGIEYTVSDAKGSPVLQVTVKTNGYEGPISITWPVSLLPDNTDPLLASVANTNSCTVTLPADSEYSFTFLKKNTTVGGVKYDLTTVYTTTDILVSEAPSSN